MSAGSPPPLAADHEELARRLYLSGAQWPRLGRIPWEQVHPETRGEFLLIARHVSELLRVARADGWDDCIRYLDEECGMRIVLRRNPYRPAAPKETT